MRPCGRDSEVAFSQGESSTPIPQAAWTLGFVDSQDTTGGNYAATNAFDGSAATFWHTQWATAQPPPPHEIQINLGGMYQVNGFRYLPRQDGLPNGRIAQYEFYVSLDGATWGTPVATGIFANVATQQEVLFTAKVGQYIRLRALSEVSGRPYTAVAELNVLSSGNRPPDSTINAPTGDVTIAPGQTVTFSGTGTDPDNNLPLTYLWNFGTGATSTSANPGAVTFPTAGSSPSLSRSLMLRASPIRCRPRAPSWCRADLVAGDSRRRTGRCGLSTARTRPGAITQRRMPLTAVRPRSGTRSGRRRSLRRRTRFRSISEACIR